MSLYFIMLVTQRHLTFLEQLICSLSFFEICFCKSPLGRLLNGSFARIVSSINTETFFFFFTLTPHIRPLYGSHVTFQSTAFIVFCCDNIIAAERQQ